MKKYRCPNCGEECLSWVEKYYFGGRHKRFYWIDYGSSNINRCEACNRFFTPFQRNKRASGLFILFSIIPFLPILYLAFVNMYFILLIFTYFLIFLLLITVVRNALFGAIIKYDENSRKPITPIPNAKITITHISGKIKVKHFDMYGIKFFETTNNGDILITPTSAKTKFNEVFTRQLVPTVFHMHKGAMGQTVLVTIMNLDSVPKELLCIGSEVAVIDNGKEIGVGYISQVREDTSR